MMGELKVPQRPVRQTKQRELFETAPDWRREWWGQPEFSQVDQRPDSSLTVNFATVEDRLEFARATGLRITEETTGLWYPQQARLRGELVWDGPKVSTRYPVCVLSKGRAALFSRPTMTVRLLEEMGVDFRVFVEETEAKEYADAVGAERVVVMPFHDLGQGSIPARNFIWDWAAERGADRYWLMDDNISEFARTYKNRRLNIKTGAGFRAVEDFADRYGNIAICGLHGKGFVMDRDPRLTPVLWNTRVYSCSLITTAAPFRWRGRYNEDTDLCLRMLKAGWATFATRWLVMQKHGTVGSKTKALPGGNTDTVYNTGDHRRAFAESLKAQHPDVVTIKWKFNRWHHEVDYSPFKRNDPGLLSSVTPTGVTDNYGIRLRRIDTTVKP